MIIVLLGECKEFSVIYVAERLAAPAIHFYYFSDVHVEAYFLQMQIMDSNFRLILTIVAKLSQLNEACISTSCLAAHPDKDLLFIILTVFEPFILLSNSRNSSQWLQHPRCLP